MNEVARGFGIAPVSPSHHRTLDPQLARFAHLRFDAAFGHDDDVGAGHRQSDGVRMFRGEGGGPDDRRRCELGCAVPIRELQSRDPALQLFDESARHGGTPSRAELPRGKVMLLELRVHQAQLVLRGHHEGVIDAPTRGGGQELLRFERRHENDAAADPQHRQDDGHESRDVRAREWRVPSAFLCGSCQTRSKCMVEWMMLTCARSHSLGFAARPGRVEDCGGILFLHAFDRTFLPGLKKGREVQLPVTCRSAIEHDEVIQLGQQIPGGKDFHESILTQEHARAGMGEDVLDFLGSQAGVQRNVNRSHAPRRERHDDVLEAIRGQRSDAVALGDSQLAQSSAESAGLLVRARRTSSIHPDPTAAPPPADRRSARG